MLLFRDCLRVTAYLFHHPRTLSSAPIQGRPPSPQRLPFPTVTQGLIHGQVFNFSGMAHFIGQQCVICAVIVLQMNDLRLLLQADKDRKIINLEFKQINNLQLMMPILSKFQNLESLSLNGNRLQLLPTDMSALQKLNELDISNNLFRDATDVVGSLKTLPRLTHLMYSFKNDEQENIVKRQLQRLERLNKKPLNNTSLVTKKQKAASSLMKLNEQDLEHIALVYDDIREMFKRSKYYVDKELAEDFDKGVDGIMGELSSKLSGASGQEEINSSIVGCKYALVNLCFVKLITYFYHFDKGIASILQRIHDQIAQAFRSMSDILRTSADRSRTEIAQVVVKKEQLFKNEIKRLKAIQENHLNEISDLQAKNAELLDKITKNSKSNVLETTISNIIKRKHSKSPVKGQTGKPAEHSQDISIKFHKTLSLHQLKQLITEIYASKAKHNFICAESNTPMETLETHMYTYLNQKYGLKPMTVEWAMSIVNGIKKYGQDDAEVAAFGKMLRNQLEQDFVEVLKKTKATVRQAIKRFKGDDSALISLHESEEVLLICGHKREVIDLIMGRVKQQQLQEGHLPPAYLEHLVLQNQLRKHCDKIKRVGGLFKAVDTDDDGIINHDQLFVLFEKLDVKADIELQDILQLLDPFHTNAITFSHFVQQLQLIPQFKEAFI